ncbi:hypothetical protein [Myxococcus qinghaiensis]|uniref:hypothetical protein n=1 Tax=Myxococcus qinghaiensis TaxID=2906758 RepID=UPI0020A7A615|nr:hypothetical protein [Myxococcus qinghaiensis]
MSLAYRWLRRPRSRGQAAAEFSLLLLGLLVSGSAFLAFAPDLLAIFTVYVAGFYLVLGYPLG